MIYINMLQLMNRIRKNIIIFSKIQKKNKSRFRILINVILF